jgi:hypothetical protein
MPGAKGPRHFAQYDGDVAEKSKGRAVKSSIGVLGALATIVSVWWFALRPRHDKDESPEEE